MILNERRVCEYFLISGFSKTRKPYDLSQIYYQGEEIFNANVEITEDFFHYKEPVVDIQIVTVNLNEKPPEGYHIVDKSYSKQHKADLNGKSSADELFLCFRCGRDKPPITDIWAFTTKQKTNAIQDQWILIEKTFNGNSANLSTSSTNGMYIGYRRAPINAPVDNLAVTDICVILRNKNEFCPPAYLRVDVPIRRTPMSNTINICYKKSMVKENVLSFQPEIIYCLPCTSTEPIVDVYNPDPNLAKSQLCLPDDISDVANFCMPWGATLESWSSKRSVPKTGFLTFVLTNVNYNRMYGAAVLFYEEINREELTDDEISNLGLSQISKINEDMKIFSNKSLCLLSRWPLFQTFNQVLSFLINENERQKSGEVLESSPYTLPIERFISQFLHTVSFPTPQAPKLLLQWDLENPIGIQLPTDALSRFGTGENFYNLVRMLDVEQIIQLFVYMLTEQKILLTSIVNSDLTGIAEALIAMIFPFKWSVVYIPFLYLRSIHIIQSPSPYLIGVDSRFFDFFRLPEGVGCIDLVTKSIKPPDNNCKYLDYNKVLPKSVLKSLRNGLLNCKTKVSSFEKQLNLRKTNGCVIDEFTIIRKRESIGESIRESFLRAVILMFKNYQECLIPLSKRQKKEDMFNAERFLKFVDKNSRILYQAIFETQLWNNFILERSYATEFDDGLAFFDRCIKSIRDMDEEAANAFSLVQTDSVIKSEHTKVVNPPDPVVGWVSKSGRSIFPKRLCSDFMLPSIHVAANIEEETGEDNDINNLIYTTPLTVNSDRHQREYGSAVSLSTPDSTIPVLQIRPEIISNGSYNVRTRRSTTKVTMLKRPFEEQKQARMMAKDAKAGSDYAWAGHLFTSSYCLWFLSLPGLIGHIQDTPGLRETGLSERVLQLAFQMLDSLCSNRLTLPDEVCYRVLFILIHQLGPSKILASDLLLGYDLNAFSYGLYNQIVLEQEQLCQIALLNSSNIVAPIKHEQTDSDLSEKSVPFNKIEVKDEKDCDSGHATLASTSLSPEEIQDSSDSGSTTLQKQELETSEKNEKIVQLRSIHRTPQNPKDRVSQLIIRSPNEPWFTDMEKTQQLLIDPKAGIIMSTTNQTLTPFLAMYHSPEQFPPNAVDDISNQIIQNTQTDPVTPAIITRTPFSEERSELHASFLTKKRVSSETNSSSDKELSLNMSNTLYEDPGARSNNLTDASKAKLLDSRLTQSDVGGDRVANKTRASFRQFKSVANKSLRSMRDMMNSVGSGAWLSPPVSKQSSELKQKPLPAGLPAPFRPWNQNSNNLESRLKTTASADLLDTISGFPDKVPVSRPCAGTVQQLRRYNNFQGVQWRNSESYESFYSDPKYEPDGSTNSLDTEPPFAVVEKVFDKVTGALGAIRLPAGKYWSEDQLDDGSPSPSIECSKCIHVHMTTCTTCENCQQLVYDDEIMNGWTGDDSDLQSECPYCSSNKVMIRFTPNLSFQVSVIYPDPENVNNTLIKKSRLAYSNKVNYLSPFVLRKELESVLDQEGESSLLKPEFIQQHAILYWNLVWYYTRLGLPTHLLSFLTIWLQKKGEYLTSTNVNDKDKYQVLVDLTGYEQVLVFMFWEFNKIEGTEGLSLYRRYISNRSLSPNAQVTNNSTTTRIIQKVLESIIANDLFEATSLLLGRRSYGKRDVSSLPLLSSERSVYRELFFLLSVALEGRIDFNIFHEMYKSQWPSIIKKYTDLVKNHDKPPSEKALYCRKVFRPLNISLN